MGTPELPVPDGLVLRPFRGVRFAVEDPAKVTSPPYDLISDADVEALLDSHPNNVVRLILPCSTPGDSSSTPHHAPEPPAPHASRPEVTSSTTHHRPSAQHTPEPAASSNHAPAETSPTTHHHPSAQDTRGPAASSDHAPAETSRTTHHPRSAHTAPEPSTPPHNIPDTTSPTTNHPPSTDYAPKPGTPPRSHPATASPSAGYSSSLAHQPPEPGASPHFRPDTASPTGEVPLEARYAEAGRTLKEWLAEGVLVPDEVPALYVYEQSGPDVLQRGLIGDVGLTDPAQRIILPHEDVMPGPVADRLALMSTTQANLEPIFLLYEGDNGTATALVDEVAAKRRPLVTAHTEDGLTHRLWAITDPAEIAVVNADLHHRQALIADGHHRYATYRVLQRQEHATAHEPGISDSSTSRHDARRPLESRTDAGGPRETRADPGRTNTGSPTTGAPTTSGPITGEPSTSEPSTSEPSTSEPSTSEPSTSEPSTSEPSTSGPDADTPTTNEPSTGSASAGGTGPWDFGLALLVDSTAYPPDLKAIHRVIPGLPLSEATERARSFWQVRYYDDLASGLAALDSVPEPAFLLAGEGGARLLTDPDPVRLARAMPPDHSDRWNSLNTSILTEFVLPVVWGMRDDERTVRIVHHDTEAAARLAVRTGGTAVILRPLAIEDVLAVAAGGERVPRKSTSFGPKPRTGLVLRTFAID